MYTSSVNITPYYIYSQSYLSFSVLFSLTEHAETQEQVSELTEKLEAAKSDRDSFEKKYQEVGKEMERVRSELAQTQTK